ncbi:MAG: CPBP family intramembrane glutamic endopeptidase [Actinomycetes bacterium]
MHPTDPPPPPVPRDPRVARPDRPDRPDRPVEDLAALPAGVTVADGLLLVLWSLLAQFVVLAPLVTLGVELGGSPASTGAVIVVINAVALAGFLAWLTGRGQLSWDLLGPGRRDRFGRVRAGVLAGGIGYLLVTGLLLAANALVGPLPQPQQQLFELLRAGGPARVLGVVSVVVFAPLVEELIFRGVLFRALLVRIGTWPAAVVSGVVFGLAHVGLPHPAQYLGLSLLGVVLALTYRRTGSLLAAGAAHATFNLVSVVLVALGAA